MNTYNQRDTWLIIDENVKTVEKCRTKAGAIQMVKQRRRHSKEKTFKIIKNPKYH